MVYFLKKSTPSKKGLYLQIYVNFYDAKTKKKKTLSYKALGYVSDLQAKGIEDPVSYFQEEVKKLNDSLFNNKVKQIGDSSPCRYAGHFLVKAMFDHLDLDRVMNIMSRNFKCKYKMSDFVRTLTYVQFLNPGSKLHSFEKVIPNMYNSIPFSYDQILDGVNFIGRDYPKFIELINHGISSRWKRNYDKVFFDCTNYYFEIDSQDDIRKKGPSKENRKDPIIGQALLLDNEQIPLAINLYPGNESEKPYLRKNIEDLKSRYDINSKIVQVADKGLNCARNIYSAVIEAKDGYIFSKSVHGKYLSKTEKQWVLLRDNENNKWTHVKDTAGNIIYSYKECIDDFEYHCKINESDTTETFFTVKEKRVVTYNPKLARKKQKEIRKELEKIKKLSAKQALKEEYGDSAKYVEFIAIDSNGEKVKIYSNLKESKINEDLALAGYNLLVTSEIEKSPTDIYNAYHGLWRIEESFRILKTYLESRPVFLQLKESIYGHFLICYFALTILRLIEIKVFNDEIPPSKLIDFIRGFNVTQTPENSFISNATNSETLSKIKDKLCLSKLDNLYLKKKDIDNFINVSFD